MPIEYGKRLAGEIHGAKLVEITPKEVDPALHARDALGAIDDFVTTTSATR